MRFVTTWISGGVRAADPLQQPAQQELVLERRVALGGGELQVGGGGGPADAAPAGAPHSAGPILYVNLLDTRFAQKRWEKHS